PAQVSFLGGLSPVAWQGLKRIGCDADADAFGTRIESALWSNAAHAREINVDGAAIPGGIRFGFWDHFQTHRPDHLYKVAFGGKKYGRRSPRIINNDRGRGCGNSFDFDLLGFSDANRDLDELHRLWTKNDV